MQNYDLPCVIELDEFGQACNLPKDLPSIPVFYLERRNRRLFLYGDKIMMYNYVINNEVFGRPAMSIDQISIGEDPPLALLRCRQRDDDVLLLTNSYLYFVSMDLRKDPIGSKIAKRVQARYFFCSPYAVWFDDTGVNIAAPGIDSTIKVEAGDTLSLSGNTLTLPKALQLENVVSVVSSYRAVTLFFSCGRLVTLYYDIDSTEYAGPKGSMGPTNDPKSGNVFSDFYQSAERPLVDHKGVWMLPDTDISGKVLCWSATDRGTGCKAPTSAKKDDSIIIKSLPESVFIEPLPIFKAKSAKK